MGVDMAPTPKPRLFVSTNDWFQLPHSIHKKKQTFQVKIASVAPSEGDQTPSPTPTAYTSQQIQLALNTQEQASLQKLIVQRKTVQTEIQTLQQKLLTPNSPSLMNATGAVANIVQQQQGQSRDR